MKVEEKQSIIRAAQAYMEEKGISQNELSKLTGVNVSYLSGMMKGVFTFVNSRTGKESEIDDKWFLALAGRIGHKVAKEYWPLVETEQFIDIVKELTEAKETATTRIIVGETGCGKSYTVERFRQAYPQGTYVVTCNQNDSISDLVRKIQKVLKVSFDGSVSYRIDRISMELSRVADNGNQPILVFDEAEYLSPRGLLSIKTIYDYLKGICAIVMIGTDDILNKLEKTKRKEGMPQFIRRFKAGIRHVRPIDRTFARFLEGRGYGKDLVRLLRLNADNYGELADYLEPAIREADRRGEPLTKEFFESMFYLQNRL